jgi:L-lactate dehydrogenase complex protein LldG
LEDYGVGVRRCGPAELGQTVAATLTTRGLRRLAVPMALPLTWRPEGWEYLSDSGLTSAELDAVDGAITACTVAIAATGTIVLCHTPTEGRRALTLVPDYHLCIVESDQIVEMVPEAFSRIEAHRPALVTMISGPSATADIEMTRVQGVHGPRTLDVLLVASSG